MGLVDYSSSSSESEHTKPVASTVLKRKRSEASPNPKNAARKLPSLPESFRDLYASAARVGTDDDPSMHGGRTRAVPHVEGNWPTHVYLEWYPSPPEVAILDKLLAAIQEALPRVEATTASPRLHSSLTNDLGVPLPLHISLSCPLVLRMEDKDRYLEAVTKKVKALHIGSKGRNDSSTNEGGFIVRLSDIDWAANAERTRWFLALRVAKPDGDELNKLLAVCNDVAESQGLPTLYARSPNSANNRTRGVMRNDVRKGNPQVHDEPESAEEMHVDVTDRFHVSVAWTLDDPLQNGKRFGAAEISGYDVKAQDLDSFSVSVGAVKVKFGNNVTSIPFGEGEARARGILG